MKAWTPDDLTFYAIYEIPDGIVVQRSGDDTASLYAREHDDFQYWAAVLRNIECVTSEPEE